jgi:DNA-directed RNA polymerase subunit L
MEVKILKEGKDELTFELIGADRSLSQLIVEKLNADKGVEFAACKVDHPVLANPVVTLRTGKGKPVDALVKSLKEIHGDISAFKEKFSELTG